MAGSSLITEPDMEALSSLVRAAQSGDLDAFDSIVGRFQDMAYASAYAMVDDAQLAEDVAQETFIEAYLNLAKLHEPAAFPGWFRRILFKQGDRLIRGKHISTIPLETAFDIPLGELNPAEVVEARERNEVVRRAVEALPEHERVVIVLFYSTGYLLKEIAAFLEVPVTTVKKRLYDGRQRLKEGLIDVVRNSLYEQRSSFLDGFSNKVRLLIAARTGDIAGVKELLDREPVLINMKAERHEKAAQEKFRLAFGYTALHEAAINNHTALVDLLIDYGANINARTSSGVTPLHEAVLHNSTDVVQLLLAYGANPNAVHANGHTSLHWAAMKGYGEIAVLLLAHGAAVNAASHNGRTALHWAALKGHQDIVKLLLDRGANIFLQDELGRTPLDWASARGHTHIAGLLQLHIFNVGSGSSNIKK